jgi:hypothetical protein
MQQYFRKAYFKTPDFKGNWRDAWSKRSFRFEFIITFFLMVGLVEFINWYFPIIQSRNGKYINDPIVNLIRPIDLSWATFIFLYTAFISGMIYLTYRPKELIILFQAMLLITSTRMCTLYLFPLEPPAGIIPLEDPILGKLVYSSKLITKDLFFSGHTVMMFMFFLVVRHPLLKIYFLFGTILVGTCVVLQHVHYSFDVIVAPLFTWIAYKIIVLVHR